MSTQEQVPAIADDSSGRVMQRFETDNPYLRKLFAHEAFGTFPNGSVELLVGLSSVMANEQLVTGLRVGHGPFEKGVLMVTTNYLRYVKKGRISSSTKNEFWQFGTGIQLDAQLGNPSALLLETGHQFQVGRIPIVSRKQAKGLFDIYNLVGGAGSHIHGELEAAALEGMAGSGGSTATEIKELAALRDAGDLSQAEFEAAKARLLGS
jgi:hypothetical protein